MADIDLMRKLKAMGLPISEISKTVGLDEKEAKEILDEVYAKNPSNQILDELDVIKQQYYEIALAKDLDPKTTAFKLEALKQTQVLLDRKLAIIERNAIVPKQNTSKSIENEIEIKHENGYEIKSGTISITDIVVWKNNVMKISKNLDGTLLTAQEKVVVIMNTLGITSALRSEMSLSSEFENELAKILNIPVSKIWKGRKILKHEVENSDRIIQKAKRRGFKLTDFK